MADELAALSPGRDILRGERQQPGRAGLRPYLDAVGGSAVSGRTYAATGTTFDRMAAASAWAT